MSLRGPEAGVTLGLGQRLASCEGGSNSLGKQRANRQQGLKGVGTGYTTSPKWARFSSRRTSSHPWLSKSQTERVAY